MAYQYVNNVCLQSSPNKIALIKYLLNTKNPTASFSSMAH